MEQVRFRLVRQYFPFTVGPLVIHNERIITWIQVVGRQSFYGPREAVVDTGAPISIFPQKVWERFEVEISWPAVANAPEWCKEFHGAAGGTVPCRVGIVPVRFLDLPEPEDAQGKDTGQSLGPTDIAAMFAYDKHLERDGYKPRQILIGLGGGPFTGRRLDMVYGVKNGITLSPV